MQNSRHLTDSEISAYTGKGRDKLSKDVADRIERHLGEPCEQCGRRVREAEEFLRFFKTKMKFEPEEKNDENNEACAWLEKIEDFIENRLSGKDREEAVKHMSDCDGCREYAAILYSAKKGKSMWLEIRQGVLRLRDAFRLAIAGSSQGFEPALGFSGMKFRGPDSGREKSSADGSADIISNDLLLPEGLGSIKIIRILQKNGMKKLSVKPLEGTENISQIEIYDNEGRLLKSVDGFESASCTISGGGCLLVINGSIEVPVTFE